MSGNKRKFEKNLRLVLHGQENIPDSPIKWEGDTAFVFDLKRKEDILAIWNQYIGRKKLKKFSSITKQLTMYGFRRDRLRNRLMFHENFVRTSALDTVSLPRKKENKSKQTQGNHTIIEDYPHLPGPDSMERGYNDLEKYNDAIFEQHILEFLDPSPESTLDAPLNIYIKPNSISDRIFGTELYSNSSVYPQVSIGKHVKHTAAVYDWSDPGFFSQI